MTVRNPFPAVAFLAFFPPAARGAEAVVAANLAAMGGAAVAASEDNAAVTANPGVMPLYARYDLHGHYQYGPDRVSRWGASAVDSRTSKWLTGGVFYAGDVGNPPIAPRDLPGWTIPGQVPSNRRRNHDITAAFAVDALDRRVGVGLSATLALYDHDLGGSGSTGNFDAGIGARPTPWLDLGVAGRNLAPIDDLGLLPTTVAAGARVHGRRGAVLADVSWRDERGPGGPWVVAAGGELPVGEAPVLRAGYRYEGLRGAHKLTAGVGIDGEGGQVALGAQIPVGPGEPTFAGTALGVSIHLAAPSVDRPPEF